MKKTNLIILGAGASVGSKRIGINNYFQEQFKIMPSSNNYFLDISKRDPSTNNSEYLNTLAFIATPAYEIINRIYNFKNRNSKSGYIAELYEGINLESMSSFFDVGMQMLPKNSEWYKMHKISQEALNYFFTFDLSMRAMGQECEYLKLILSKLNDYDSIISFNWDEICDNTLRNIDNEIQKNYIKLLKNQKFKIKDFQDRGNYLKMHGSLNWRICNNKKCKNYNKTKLVYPIIRNNAIIDNYKCPTCSKETKPAIIPPSSNKFINKNEFIHKLWLLARETLIKTDRLVFIGYSFPPNDYMAEWLFKHIYLTEDYENKNTLPEIVIVNPEIKKKK